MKILVTGGAGFIGRWVVKRFIDNHEVIVLDNLNNGNKKNLEGFHGDPNFKFVEADILDRKALNEAFKEIDLCLHLAAQTSVQKSLDNPEETFQINVLGTHNILENCRKNNTKLVLVGTCMVYDRMENNAITEEHPIKPVSPYAGSKIAAEELAISYFYGYGLPVVIVRPFNTYGPYQKSNTEGGVVSIFIQRHLDGKNLLVYGDCKQNRDLLYVEDCADFMLKAWICERDIGEVINAGTGRDISINNLALTICKDEARIRHITHHHPQSEISKLVCNYSKAKKLLGWEPQTSIEEGIQRTEDWMRKGEKKL